MSLKEKLGQERELKAELTKKQEQDKLVAELAEIESKKQLILKKRVHLADAMAAFSMAYNKASEAQDSFVEKSQGLDELMTDYKDVLLEKGIDSKGKLVSDRELGQETEAQEYKESGLARRKNVNELRKLKTIRPELNFRSGKKEGEEKSPRELAMEALQREVDDLDIELNNLKEEEDTLLGKKDSGAEDFLTKLCAEEFSKLDINNGVDYNFYLNGKPGFRGSFDLVKLGQKYSPEVAKKLFQESIYEKYYPEENQEYLSGGKKADLKSAVDMVWADADLRLTLNDKSYEPAKEYLQKKADIKSFLEGNKYFLVHNNDSLLDIKHEGEGKYSRAIVSEGEFHQVRDDLYRKQSEVGKQGVTAARLKMNEAQVIEFSNSLFVSKKKRDAARIRNNFFTAMKDAFDHSYSPEENPGIWKQAQQALVNKNITQEEFDGFKKMSQMVAEYKSQVAEATARVQNINNRFVNNIPGNILNNADWLADGKIGIKDLMNEFTKRLEDLKGEAIANGVEEKAEELTAKFKAYIEAFNSAKVISQKSNGDLPLIQEAKRYIGEDYQDLLKR